MDSSSSSLWTPQGVSKSNSTASTGGRSTKSYESVKGIGAYPFGTLRLIRPDDSPRHSFDADDDCGPPPLDPPAAASSAKQPVPRRDPMAHDMGGGDVVLVLHLPKESTIGYDNLSFTANHFIGLKNIPPGPHFFWTANTEAASVRCGFWIMSTSVEKVHVMQWDSFNEVFVRATRTESRIQAENVASVFDQLPTFRDPTAMRDGQGRLGKLREQENFHLWREMAGGLDANTLDRIMSEQEDGWIVHTCDRVKASLVLPSEADINRRLARPIFRPHELRFSFEQQAKTFSTALVGRARTRDARDSTSHIISFMLDAPTRRLSEDDVVGEFQFAYIVGVYVGNEACMQQWWYLALRIVLRAYRLLVRRPKLAAALLGTLGGQLAHSVRWLDNSILDFSEVNALRLRVALIIFKRRMRELLLPIPREGNLDRALVSIAFSRIEGVVAQIGWHLSTEYIRRGKIRLEDGERLEVDMDELDGEDERGEWAPEIIEMDEYGRQIGLVSLSS